MCWEKKGERLFSLIAALVFSNDNYKRKHNDGGRRSSEGGTDAHSGGS